MAVSTATSNKQRVLAADHEEPVAFLTVPDGGRVALAAFTLLFTAHSAWCVGLFTAVMHRAAHGLGPGRLRTGLRLVVAGGTAGLVWVAASLMPLVAGLRTGRQDNGEDAFSGPVALLALVLGIGGATLVALPGRVSGPLRRLRARRSHRRLGPLWTELRAIRPEIVLEPPGSGLRLHGRAEFALYRRVIEIRDAQLWLRAHQHPKVPRWAAAACGGMDDHRRAAVVEAAVLAAALEAAEAGHRRPPAPDEAYVPPAALTDLDAETDWLILVTEEFADSPVVARIRDRVRRELTTVGGFGRSEST
ncbi:MAB_1171c family putative transporter [Kitasatospora sp. NPDC056138]|uniref:MAB_1171c family putative transporter n=1 Tax=Kitasatospora sp. NPDC056138 TaxID=3345724 RepID=UPI0035DB8D70